MGECLVPEKVWLWHFFFTFQLRHQPGLSIGVFLLFLVHRRVQSPNTWSHEAKFVWCNLCSRFRNRICGCPSNSVDPWSFGQCILSPCLLGYNCPILPVQLCRSRPVLFNYVHGVRIPLESIDERSIEVCFP